MINPAAALLLMPVLLVGTAVKLSIVGLVVWALLRFVGVV